MRLPEYEAFWNFLDFSRRLMFGTKTDDFTYTFPQQASIFFRFTTCEKKMSGVGFEPTRANTADLKSAPLDHSGIQTCGVSPFFCFFSVFLFFLFFVRMGVEEVALRMSKRVICGPFLHLQQLPFLLDLSLLCCLLLTLVVLLP